MSLQEQGGEPQTQCACPHGSTCAVRDAAGSKGRSCRGVGGVTVCGQDPQPPSVAHRAAARSARMPLGNERRAAGWRPHRVLAAALAARTGHVSDGAARVNDQREVAGRRAQGQLGVEVPLGGGAAQGKMLGGRATATGHAAMRPRGAARRSKGGAEQVDCLRSTWCCCCRCCCPLPAGAQPACWRAALRIYARLCSPFPHGAVYWERPVAQQAA